VPFLVSEIRLAGFPCFAENRKSIERRARLEAFLRHDFPSTPFAACPSLNPDFELCFRFDYLPINLFSEMISRLNIFFISGKPRLIFIQLK
jgi:hypothetical protein